MDNSSYHTSGLRCLHRAGIKLRELAILKFLYGTNDEGVFLSQLSFDMRSIASGKFFRETATFRAFRAYQLACRPKCRHATTARPPQKENLSKGEDL